MALCPKNNAQCCCLPMTGDYCHYSDAVAKTQREYENHISELKFWFKEAANYLDTNELTNIGHGSVLHRKFRELSS